MTMNMEWSEALALISALGALAALLSTDGGESQRPIYDLGERFGLSPDLPEDSVDTSNPDGSDTDPGWVGDVGDSAPETDDRSPDSGSDWQDVPDVPDDSVSVTDPDGGDSDDGWLGDVGDSAPETDDDPSLNAGSDTYWGW
jgi:hypothetical protein